ncbi:MAG: sodium:proton antiporter [Chloroflexota bacterium]|nr:sodium:proton antiporter [Chloroflexota bacterium]
MHNLTDLGLVPLIGLTFVLGLRHGLDADHLSCIDGLTRFNQSQGRRVAPWCGTLFSFGHSLVIVALATALGLMARRFEPPAAIDHLGSVLSIALLTLVGSLNAWYLLRAAPGEEVQLAGIKNRLLPRFISQASHPAAVMLVGCAFALAADTFSQAALFGLAGGAGARFGGLLPTLLGLIFMAGMVLVDTGDGHIVYRVLSMPSATARLATRVTGWVVVALAYGVATYELAALISPRFDIRPEVLGLGVLGATVLTFALSRTMSKRAVTRSGAAWQ